MRPSLMSTLCCDTIASAHRVMYLYGHLQNAAIVSQRNRTLSNNLDVLRTPVASTAYASYAEVGCDILPFFASRQADQLYTAFAI